MTLSIFFRLVKKPGIFNNIGCKTYMSKRRCLRIYLSTHLTYSVYDIFFVYTKHINHCVP